MNSDSTLLAVLVFAFGVWVVVATLLSAIRTVVLPRAATSWLSGSLFRLVRRGFTLVAPPKRTYEFRDRVWAMFSPVALLGLAGVWVMMVGLGYSAMFWAVGYGSIAESVWVSGSSLLTLGFAPVNGWTQRLMAFSEATIGLGLIALLIAFLPSMYAAFSARERLVALLDVRAGTPPSPVVFLRRMWQVGGLERMERSWEDWEKWFADLQETHTSYPALNFFRSPHPYVSWLTAAGTVLDASAIYVSIVRSERNPQAEIMVRAGFLALRRICDLFGLEYDPDPAPGDPISITREEFDHMVDELEEAGLPIEANRDEAWDAFRGWRVNYDTTLLRLADFVMAPTAPWSSDRSPVSGSSPSQRRWRRARSQS